MLAKKSLKLPMVLSGEGELRCLNKQRKDLLRNQKIVVDRLQDYEKGFKKVFTADICREVVWNFKGQVKLSFD